MIRSSFICLLLSCVICSFCGKDFVSLGRHQWRCKEKITDPYSNVYPNHPTSSRISAEPVISSPNSGINKKSGTKCYCGKICKGTRGLKMHQRNCQVILGLNNELVDNIFEHEECNNICGENLNDLDSTSNPNTNYGKEYPELKKGINLPKTDSEWQTANEDFKFSLMSYPPIRSTDLNTSIKLLNNTIYSYFAGNFGFTESLPNDLLVKKYKSHSIKELKKALKYLKSSNSDLAEIRYVSRLVRNMLKSDTTNNIDESLNHDKYIGRNFWGYVKKFIECNQSTLPTFNMDDCLRYFKTVLTKINPNKIFNIPNWIPKLPNPLIEFDLQPPNYQQTTNIIRKMKTSGSPCPLDQISIICFKRCPYLRTYLTELIQAVWLSGSVPDEWKKACTILIHKKNDTNLPENFRPITLQSVPLKVFTSCIRNAMFLYLIANNFTEHSIQKGFTPYISGTFEHTAQMAYIINQARIRQRSLVITLLDLKKDTII
ncbi:uncharacterized protein LOC114535400 [Dendronephthya gigantea]|uniref:uncharacterized protein LOC114535400 n=1 Tax=Dendronephthya gigantea TaxID=151771 RepID=UPI00106D88C1|nr:uncharacterized protein LOC114535400 [Dendronephthya gigantea]